MTGRFLQINSKLLVVVLGCLVFVGHDFVVAQKLTSRRFAKPNSNRFVLVDDVQIHSKRSDPNEPNAGETVRQLEFTSDVIEQACFSGDQIVASIESNTDIDAPRYSISQLSEVLFHTLRTNDHPESQRKAIITALQIAAGNQVIPKQADASNSKKLELRLRQLERALLQMTVERDQLQKANEQYALSIRQQHDKIQSYRNLESLLSAVKHLESQKKQSRDSTLSPVIRLASPSAKRDSVRQARNQPSPIKRVRSADHATDNGLDTEWKRSAAELKSQLSELKSQLKTIQDQIDRIPDTSAQPRTNLNQPLRPLFVPDGNRLRPLRSDSDWKR